jgi:hypothetical protein
MRTIQIFPSERGELENVKMEQTNLRAKAGHVKNIEQIVAGPTRVFKLKQ